MSTRSFAASCTIDVPAVGSNGVAGTTAVPVHGASWRTPPLSHDPSLKGRLAAKKATIERVTVEAAPSRLEKLRLAVPQEERKQAQVLGEGAAAAPRVVEVLRELGLVGP